jgi:acetyl esterase/lipase
MFEHLLFAVFAVSTFAFLKPFVGTIWWQPRMWVGKMFKGIGLAFSLLISLTVISITVLEATAPKGSFVYEAARLPRHFYLLNQQEVKNLEIQKVFYGSYYRQYMLICKPSQVTIEQDKIIFFIHGGGWHIGKPENHLKVAESLAEEGYIVLMPAYRRGPVFDFDDINQDMTKALEKALEIRIENGWEDKTIVLGGTSAGGNLAALLLFNTERHEALGINQDIFSGMFTLAGALDLDKMSKSPALRRYAGKSDSERFRSANPVNYISKDAHVPVMCIQGIKDGLVSEKSADSFVKYLKDIDSNLVQYYKVPDASHIEISSAWYYDKSADFGQMSALKKWLNSL